MNIEELSKSQLILLTILVNFVTSVATGILTVSLLVRKELARLSEASTMPSLATMQIVSVILV